MTKRLAFLMLALAFAVAPVAACNDNAEDHSEEAGEEAASGDTEEAREETQEMNDDLEPGATTELAN